MQIVLIVIAAVVLIIIVWAISTSNTFKRLLVKIDESDSGIDVALTKRYDTLTKLLDVCKQYTKHETELLSGLVKLRKGMDINEKTEANQKMDELQAQLTVIAEAYPQLQSSENFKQLQDSIVDAEDHLQAARRIYNMNVSSYNQSIALFPSSIIAGVQNLLKKEFFAAEEHKKSDVEMKF